MAENLTPKELQRLQMEAVKRAKEMQNMAQRATYNSQKGNRRPMKNNKNSNQSKDENSQNTSTNVNKINMPKEIFDVLLKDSERTIILILILLLTNENADPSIILALMYLII